MIRDVDFVVVVSLITVVSGLVAIFRGAIGKAIARRLEGAAAGADLEVRVHELESRVLAGEQERLELAERLEFAERMLAKSEPARLEVR